MRIDEFKAELKDGCLDLTLGIDGLRPHVCKGKLELTDRSGNDLARLAQWLQSVQQTILYKHFTGETVLEDGVEAPEELSCYQFLTHERRRVSPV